MTKYYSDQTPYSGRVNYEEVHAISDRPNARGMYPRATMTVRHQPARERENFKQLVDSTNVSRGPAEQQVYNATGFRKQELAGNLQDAHALAVGSAQHLLNLRDNPEGVSKHYRRQAGIWYAQNIRDIKN